LGPRLISVLDVEVRLEGEVLGGGVEVHVEARALVVLQVLDEVGAKGRLARRGRALGGVSIGERVGDVWRGFAAHHH
jgi:hypothetical protein